VVERLELLLAGGLDRPHVEAGRPLRRHRPRAAHPHPRRARAAEAAAPVRHAGCGGHRFKPNGSGSARSRRGYLSPAWGWGAGGNALRGNGARREGNRKATKSGITWPSCSGQQGKSSGRRLRGGHRPAARRDGQGPGANVWLRSTGRRHRTGQIFCAAAAACRWWMASTSRVVE